MSDFYKDEKEIDSALPSDEEKVIKEYGTKALGDNYKDLIDYKVKTFTLVIKRSQIVFKLSVLILIGAVILFFALSLEETVSSYLDTILPTYLEHPDPLILVSYGLGVLSLLAVLVTLCLALLRNFVSQDGEESKLETAYTALLKELHQFVKKEPSIISKLLEAINKALDTVRK